MNGVRAIPQPMPIVPIPAGVRLAAPGGRLLESDPLPAVPDARPNGRETILARQADAC